MTLSFKVFGFEVASVDLDIERDEQSPIETVVDKAVSATSRWWVGRMFKK